MCRMCANPLNLFVQLSSQDLPPEAGSPFGEGILQLFYCVSSDPLCEVDAEAWAPFSSNVIARIVPLTTRISRVEHATFFPLRMINGWHQTVDYPSWEESVYAELEILLSDEEEDIVSEHGYPLVGDKLLGWPAWVQGPEYPHCPRCHEPMVVVFQIDSEDNIPYMFGDVGCGHLSQCRNHPDVVAFAWACS